MASPLDKPLRKVSRSLLRKFGVPVTVSLKGDPGVYNPTTRMAADPDDPVAVPTRALVEPFKARVQERQGGGGLTSSAVRAREAKWTVPALDFEASRGPRPGDQAVLGNYTFEVLGVDPVYSGEQVAIYELHVRR